MLRCLLAWFPFDLTRVSECGSVKSASMSRLSLSERLWGGRVSDPPVKAGAERKKKTAGLFLEGGNPGWAPSRRGGNPAAAQPRSRPLTQIPTYTTINRAAKKPLEGTAYFYRQYGTRVGAGIFDLL